MNRDGQAIEPGMVELDRLTIRVGSGRRQRTLYSEVSERFSAGTMTCVLGPSGCGKTTLLHAIAGLHLPSSGRVLVAGRDVGSLTESGRLRLRRRTVSLVFQQYNLVNILTAAENVALGMELAGSSRKESLAKATKLMAEFGLTDLCDAAPETLSGGEQQRVAICRALAAPHSVVLADEPTGALDATNGADVIAALHRLSRQGKCCIVVTHNPRVAQAADRVVTVNDGALQ